MCGTTTTPARINLQPSSARKSSMMRKRFGLMPRSRPVVICSETNRHHDLVLAAAAAGKHVFAEKPMGIGSAESYEMADALDNAHVFFTTGYFTRTVPAIQFLKQQVDQGVFGKITRVRGSNCHNGSLGHWFDTDWRWMADPKIAGVGGFGDLGTHYLDILMWMFGDVQTVAADIKVVTGNYGDCDESGEALIKFKNGITGTLGAGWVDVADPVTLMISGTEGHAYIDKGKLFLTSKIVEGADGKSAWTKLPLKLCPTRWTSSSMPWPESPLRILSSRRKRQPGSA